MIGCAHFRGPLPWRIACRYPGSRLDLLQPPGQFAQPQLGPAPHLIDPPRQHGREPPKGDQAAEEEYENKSDWHHGPWRPRSITHQVNPSLVLNRLATPATENT